MSKKMKVLVSMLVAVLLLTVGGTAVVLAQEDEEPAPTPRAEASGLLARVAEILDIPEEDLVNAFSQARGEIRQERCEGAFTQALEKAVEEGILTQEEAGEIREWWEQKPEALGFGLLQNACGVLGPRARNMAGGGWEQWSEMNQLQWRGMRPEIGAGLLEKALDQMPPRAFKAIRGRHMIAVTRGWNGPMPYQMAE